MSKNISETDFDSKVIEIGKILNGISVLDSTRILQTTIRYLNSNSIVNFV